MIISSRFLYIEIDWRVEEDRGIIQRRDYINLKDDKEIIKTKKKNIIY